MTLRLEPFTRGELQKIHGATMRVLERTGVRILDPEAVRLEEIMSRNLVSVDANAGIDQVAQIMASQGTRRVLVVKDGKILGVIQAKTILARMKEYIDRLSAQIARTQTPMF